MPWNSKWQYFFSSKRNSHHTLKSWNKPALSLQRAGVQFNLCNVLWDPAVFWHSTYFTSCYLGMGCHTTRTQGDALTQSPPWSHHDPGLFPSRNKSPESPSQPILTGFSCPRGRGDTVPVTLTTDSSGALDRSSFRWECACRESTEPDRNPNTRQRHLGQAPPPKITLKAGETALMFLLQCQVRALTTLQSPCKSEHSVWQSPSCSLRLLKPSTKGKIKTQTRVLVALTSSWGMTTWVSPWKSLKTRKRPCLIHEKHKRKNIFFTNLEVSTF